MLLESYKYHRKIDLLEMKRVAQRSVGIELERVSNQSDSQNSPVQYKVQHTSPHNFAATKDHVQFPLTPLTCTYKSATLLQTQRLHCTRPLPMGEAAPVSQKVDPMHRALYWCVRRTPRRITNVCSAAQLNKIKCTRRNCVCQKKLWHTIDRYFHIHERIKPYLLFP